MQINYPAPDGQMQSVEFKDINDEEFLSVLQVCSPYTMHTQYGAFDVLFSLYHNVKYIIEHDIPGDFVECGVWSGGLILLIAEVLLRLGVTDRKIYLYDTFEGMPKPDDVDKDWEGIPAGPTWEHYNNKGKKWGYGGQVENVKEVLDLSKYPSKNYIFVEGMVEDTIPKNMPEEIALLRLDTDFYSSTYHELVHLYPLISVGGVLIIDDYGYYQGARKATDQYFDEKKVKMFLSRIHSSVRMGIKIEDLK